jgi:hypothetical protein
VFVVQRAAASLVCLLFVFVPVGSALLDAGPVAPEEEAASPAGPPAFRQANAPRATPYDHILRQTSPDVWAPVLLSTGSLAQAADAAKATAGIGYSVYPLGDANKDGFGDYLLENRTYSGEDASEIEGVKLSARSGADSSVGLWTYDLPRNAYYYLLRDITGDGVDELVVEVSQASSCDGVSQGVIFVGAYQYDCTIPSKYVVVSGADGKDLFQLDAMFEYAVRVVYASPLVAGVYSFSMTYAYGFLVRSGTGPAAGVDIVHHRYEYDDTWAFAVLLSAYVSRSASTTAIDHYDATGKKLWSSNLDFGLRDGYLMDIADYTGDKVPDYLFTIGGSTWYARAFVTGAPLPPYEETRVVLLNGANGQPAWDVTTDPYLGEGVALPGGLLQSGKRHVILHQFGFESANGFSTFGTRITTLDGATGSALDSRRFEEQLALAVEFGDADGDGADELLHLRVPYDADEFVGDMAVVKRDFSIVWTLSNVNFEESYWWFEAPAYLPDVNGDGMPDLLFYRPYSSEGGTAGELRALNGATGEPLWTYLLHHKIYWFDFVQDITGDGGSDIVLVWFDRPKAPEDREARQEFNRNFNITDYPGYLELRRGKDTALAWKRIVHEPRPEISAKHVILDVYATPDTNDNGVADVLFSLETPRCEWVVAPVEPQGDGPMGLTITCEAAQLANKTHLNFALVLEGADGVTLASFPQLPPASLPQKEPAQLGEAAPVPLRNAKAPPAKQPGLLPGFEWALALLGAALVLRRRR